MLYDSSERVVFRILNQFLPIFFYYIDSDYFDNIELCILKLIENKTKKLIDQLFNFIYTKSYFIIC
jgi:hypothetical protein